jgi:prevent-host-death family protein
MFKRHVVTQVVRASEARQNWSKLLKRVHSGDVRLVVEKGGIPVAGIVSAPDLERLTLFERERERRFAILDEIGQAFKDVPEDELQREIDKALAEVREEMRAERQASHDK